MARQPYRITETDFLVAKQYLEKRVHKDAWITEDIEAANKAEKKFKKASATPETLTDWCYRYLPAERWTQVKNVIRATRRRRKHPEIKCITITTSTWYRLKALAARDSLTLSDVLERYLPRVDAE